MCLILCRIFTKARGLHNIFMVKFTKIRLFKRDNVIIIILTDLFDLFLYFAYLGVIEYGKEKNDCP